MASFGTKQINYHENRTTDSSEWDVRYGLKFDGDVVTTTLKVKLTGDDPGAIQAMWEKGVNDIWNQRAFFSDGTRLYEVRLDFDFVSFGQHQTVEVFTGSGRANMRQWYLDDPWGPDKYDEVAAHEIGHMLGNFDEYLGGATYDNGTTDGVVRTNTLMSDLKQGGFQNYFWTIEFFTEQYSNQTMSTVLAQRGTGAADTLAGNGAMNGIYGFGGADLIDGAAGNDWLDGGSGNDTIDGGYGDDRVFGAAGNDVLDGSWGFDTIDGGAGNDTVDHSFFSGDAKFDLARGRITFTPEYSDGGRVDTLVSIENVLAGSGNDTLVGDTQANGLTGGAGKDKLRGKEGQDTLMGGSGADRFHFDTKLSASSNVDRIGDFKIGVDKICLDDAIFGAIGVTLTSNEFYAAAGASKAHDKDDRIIYDTNTGKLYFDADGSGIFRGAVLFATIDGHPSLGYTDCAIV